MIVYQGDIHLRDTNPATRVDDYYQTQFEKLSVLLCSVKDGLLLLGGDLFDSHRVSARLLNDTIACFRAAELPPDRVLTVLGQHDVPYHDMSLSKSPVGILEAAGCLTCLRGSQRVGNTVVHGVSWEDDREVLPVKWLHNVLLGHLSTFKSIPHYWKGLGYTPKTLKERYPGFDLYLVGDIHGPLVDSGVIVSGSMMRLSINQADYKPRFYMIGVTGTITPVFYQVEADVFSATIDDDPEKSSINLDALIEALRSSADGSGSFKRDCLSLSDNDKEASKIIKETFDDLER